MSPRHTRYVWSKTHRESLKLTMESWHHSWLRTPVGEPIGHWPQDNCWQKCIHVTGMSSDRMHARRAGERRRRCSYCRVIDSRNNRQPASQTGRAAGAFGLIQRLLVRVLDVRSVRRNSLQFRLMLQRDAAPLRVVCTVMLFEFELVFFSSTVVKHVHATGFTLRTQRFSARRAALDIFKRTKSPDGRSASVCLFAFRGDKISFEELFLSNCFEAAFSRSHVTHHANSCAFWYLNVSQL